MSNIQTIFNKLDSNFSSQYINNIDGGEYHIIFKCGENSYIRYTPSDDDVKLFYYCELSKFNTEQKLFDECNGMLPIFEFTINNDNANDYVETIDNLINILNKHKEHNIDVMFDLITKIVRISNVGDTFCSSTIKLFTAKTHNDYFSMQINIIDNKPDVEFDEIGCMVSFILNEKAVEKSVDLIIPRFSKDGETIVIKGDKITDFNLNISPLNKLSDLIDLVYDINYTVDEELKSQSIWSKIKNKLSGIW